MSTAALFFALVAIEVAGLFIIWFRLKSKVGRYLELDNLLDGVREEARALVLELNETADRSVSLVEDRIAALRELLDELDRRIGVEKREMEKRSVEREVYSRLSRRRPIVPSPEAPGMEQPRPEPPNPEPPRREPPRQELPSVEAPPAPREGGPIPLSLGASATAAEAVRMPARSAPEVSFPGDVLVNSKTKREEALELYRRGISADLIAARLGATVAEIELLVELEERRASVESGTKGNEDRF